MKRKIRKILCLLLCVSAMLLLSCCASGETADPWASAQYTEDAEFGEGSKTLTVDVVVGEERVTFTIHTEAETVGQALLEHELIAGDEGEFGLYIKQVNGITADFDVDQSYWGFNINGEYAMTGADMTVIEEGVVYELVYSK